MSHRIQTADYRHLFDHIRQQTGLRVKDERFEQTAQLIDRILGEMSMTSTYELLQALSRRPITDPLWQDIIQGITIGETYFFRNQAHINALRNYVLSELIDRRRESGQKLLRIWSALPCWQLILTSRIWNAPAPASTDLRHSAARPRIIFASSGLFRRAANTSLPVKFAIWCILCRSIWPRMSIPPLKMAP